MKIEKGEKLTGEKKARIMANLHGPEAKAKKKLLVEQKKFNKAFANMVNYGMLPEEVNRLFGIKKTEQGEMLSDRQFEKELQAASDKLEVVLSNNMVTQALGYDYTEETIDYIKSESGQWKENKKKRVQKHQSGNATVLMFLMCNRYPDRWKVSKEMVTKKEGYDAQPSKRARKQIEALATGILEQNTDGGKGESGVPGGPARISDGSPEGS